MRINLEKLEYFANNSLLFILLTVQTTSFLEFRISIFLWRLLPLNFILSSKEVTELESHSVPFHQSLHSFKNPGLNPLDTKSARFISDFTLEFFLLCLVQKFAIF